MKIPKEDLKHSAVEELPATRLKLHQASNKTKEYQTLAQKLPDYAHFKGGQPCITIKLADANTVARSTLLFHSFDFDSSRIIPLQP
ncbi:hypothetical protein TNCV_2943101 [Trichonephila clavipes]|nr:hypothetical protein TNCV_2943101 [Trichonephila clavipes]